MSISRPGILPLLLLFGCGDPVQTTEVDQTPPETPTTSSTNPCNCSPGSATFTDSSGAIEDWTDVLCAGTAGSPVGLALDRPGTLDLCPQDWHALLEISASATVQGQGPSTRLIGADTGTVVTQEAAAGLVTLADLTIREGLSDQPNQGGGVWCKGGQVALNSVILEENESVTGGGIYADGCTVTMDGTTVHNNTAAQGGGVFLNHGDATLADVVVSNNEAGLAGGIAVLAGTVEMTSGSLAGNISSDIGGGALLQETDAILAGVMVENNVAGTHGGGVYLTDTTATVRDTEFRTNQAGIDGGGLCAYTGSDAEIENAIFIDNNATFGGGLYLLQSTASVQGALVEGNTASQYAGGVFINVDSMATLTNIDIVDNVAVHGGGMRVFLSAVDMLGATFQNNQATMDGGGAYLDDWSVVIVEGLTMSDNTAGNFGGGLYEETFSTLELGTADLTNNTAAAGGGIYIRDGASMSGTQVSFTGNDIGDVQPENGLQAQIGYAAYVWCSDYGCI